MRAAKAQRAQHGADRLGLVAVVDQLEELDAMQPRRMPAGLARHLVLEPQERAHAVGRGLPRRAGTEVVAEDLVADRPAIAGRGDLAHHLDHRQIALARKAAIVPAQEQQIHLDPGRVGGLHQDDAIARDVRDRLDRAFARQRVECVQDQPDPRMVGLAHRLPGLAVVVDVPAPAQGLETDGDPVSWPRARLARAGRPRPAPGRRSRPGETLLQTRSRLVPSRSISSSLRRARSKARARSGSGRPSKSRKGCSARISRPREAARARTSSGLPSK